MSYIVIFLALAMAGVILGRISTKGSRPAFRWASWVAWGLASLALAFIPVVVSSGILGNCAA